MARFSLSYPDDSNLVLRLDVNMLDGIIRPLFGWFVFLNILDFLTTAVASRLPAFFELNRVASQLFAMGDLGLLLAGLMKLLPIVPIFFIVFAKDRNASRSLLVRSVKVGALVALIYGDLFFFYAVALNNLPTLVRVLVS